MNGNFDSVPVGKQSVTISKEKNLKKALELIPLFNKLNEEPTKQNFINLKNQGLEFRELKNNNWEIVYFYNDDFEKYHYTLLYTKYFFKPYAIGRYLKLT